MRGTADPAFQGRVQLLAAFVLSVLLHVVLLSMLHLPDERVARRPRHEVSLTARIVDAPAPVQPRAEPLQAMQPSAVRSADATPRVAAATAPAAPSSRPRPVAHAQPSFVAADQLTDPPLALDDPFEGEPVAAVQTRRLRVTVWIAGDGAVLRAEVPPNEISAETAAQLAGALTRIRFAPGRIEGRAVATMLGTVLCFDAEGRLEDGDSRCMRVPRPTMPAPAPER